MHLCVVFNIKVYSVYLLVLLVKAVGGKTLLKPKKESLWFLLSLADKLTPLSG